MSSRTGEARTQVAARWITNGTFLWGVSSVGLLEQAVALFPGGLLTTAEVRTELVRHVDERPFLNTAVEAIDAGRIMLTASAPTALRAISVPEGSDPSTGAVVARTKAKPATTAARTSAVRVSGASEPKQ